MRHYLFDADDIPAVSPEYAAAARERVAQFVPDIDTEALILEQLGIL